MKWLNFKKAAAASIFSFAALLLTAPAAQAEPFTYSPENCEFQITFPGEPHTTRRCHPDRPERCELVTGFTKVYDLAVTMNFYVTCKDITPETARSYDRELMRTVLIGMAGQARLEEFETAFDDSEDIRRGSILAAGRSPNNYNDMLYMGQIWVGEHSMMTVEGELIGDPYEQTDEDFARILRSVSANTWSEEENKSGGETGDISETDE